MKLLRSTTNKDGSSTVTVRLQPGEGAVIKNGAAHAIAKKVEPVMVDTQSYYKLGGQLDMVVEAHVITEATPVYWCSFEQKWLEA